MNLINNLPKTQKSTLSKLGLNVNALSRKINGKKQPPMLSEIIFTLEYILQSAKKNDDLIYYDICDSKFLKLETIFKGIWTCRNNIYPSRLSKLMENDENKELFIQRIDLIKQTINNNLRLSN